MTRLEMMEEYGISLMIIEGTELKWSGCSAKMSFDFGHSGIWVEGATADEALMNCIKSLQSRVSKVSGIVHIKDCVDVSDDLILEINKIFAECTTEIQGIKISYGGFQIYCFTIIYRLNAILSDVTIRVTREMLDDESAEFCALSLLDEFIDYISAKGER